MILHMDGFEQYANATDLAMAYAKLGTPTILPASGRNGTGCIKTTSSGIEKSFGGTRDTIFCAFAFYIEALPTSLAPVIYFKASASIHISLAVRPTGILEVRRGTTAGVLLGSGSTALAVGVWHYLECKIKINDTTGIAQVKLNGVFDIDLVNVDTRESSFAIQVDDIAITGSLAYYGQAFRYDDLIIFDTTSPNNDFLGDLHIVTTVPDAAGDSTQWTPSAGANYQCVDEATPNGDTDYVYSSTPGQVDLYNIADLPVAGTVFAVALASFARKDDAATRTMRHVLKSGATQAEGADKGLATGYTMFSDVWDQDPNTSATWAAAAVNALQAGVKVQS